MEWSTVSKAADKSKRIREVTSPRSIARMRSLWILIIKLLNKLYLFSCICCFILYGSIVFCCNVLCCSAFSCILFCCICFCRYKLQRLALCALYIVITIDYVYDCRQCVAAIKPVVVPKVTSVTSQIRSASRLPPTTSNPCWRRIWQPSQNQSNNSIEIMTCLVLAVDLAQMGKRVVYWHRASTAAVRTQTWVLNSFRTRHLAHQISFEYSRLQNRVVASGVCYSCD